MVRDWPPLDQGVLPRVSIVIPVNDRPVDLRTCLLSLAQLDYPQDLLEVIVVDDGSSDSTPQVAVELGAKLVESGLVGGGPAAARNKGASVASGEILAFIDSDCTASPEWLQELLPAFRDEDVAAVGGWVDGMHSASSLDRYEAVMSSLNLGRRAMTGGAGGDTFYLPSCNLLMRKKAFDEAGGFNASMHVGEDVDLTWRLRDGGWTIVYLPKGSVCHAHRSLLWPFMKRRFDYGTSEGALQQLHPVRGKKLLMPPMPAGVVGLLALALVLMTPWPLLPALGLSLADMFMTRKRVLKQGAKLSLKKLVLARLRATGSLSYYVSFHLLRYYMVPMLLLSLLFPPFFLLLGIMLMGVASMDHYVRKSQLFLPLFWFYYLLEDVSYGSGVFM
ncbi:MAG: mycofactocin biosynthesis glycosyltransferase MftF, partial [Desulfuromonadaceae bacterium]